MQCKRDSASGNGGRQRAAHGPAPDSDFENTPPEIPNDVIAEVDRLRSKKIEIGCCGVSLPVLLILVLVLILILLVT